MQELKLTAGAEPAADEDCPALLEQLATQRQRPAGSIGNVVGELIARTVVDLHGQHIGGQVVLLDLRGRAQWN
jgi:hypothetical protein